MEYIQFCKFDTKLEMVLIPAVKFKEQIRLVHKLTRKFGNSVGF